MNNKIVMVEEEERLCGLRRPGGYLVSSLNATEGSVHLGPEAAGVILLEHPVPVNVDTIPKRGFVYVDGDTIMAAPAVATEPLFVPQRLTPQEAANRAFAWSAFGLAWEERAQQGLMADIGDAMRALLRLDALDWGDRDKFLRNAVDIKFTIDVLRGERGDVELWPLAVGIQDAYSTALDGWWHGTSLRGAGATVAATWRLLQAAHWCHEPQVADWAAIVMLPNAGAAADIELANSYRPTRRLPPDILDWVGEKFYPTMDSFVDEARAQGVSRRCPSGGPPKGVISGWSRAFLAHTHCQFADGSEGPGIFGYYIVAQMQYVVDQDMEVPVAYRQRRAQGMQTHTVEKKKKC